MSKQEYRENIVQQSETIQDGVFKVYIQYIIHITDHKPWKKIEFPSQILLVPEALYHQPEMAMHASHNGVQA